MLRQPAVAGSFYPSDPAELRETLGRCFGPVPREPRPGLVGALVPHAGYVYSGSVAARAYSRLPEAETYVIVGPNHRGRGPGVAVSTEPWETPLGVAEPDLDLIEALPRAIIDADEGAHRQEHSLEVQVPFLQFLFGLAPSRSEGARGTGGDPFAPSRSEGARGTGGDPFAPGEEHRQVRPVRIVAVAMALQDSKTAREVAGELRAAQRATGRRVVLLASSDFTHYESEAVARARDTPVLDAIVRRDPAEFYRRLEETGASLCGFGAIGVLLYFLSEGGGGRACGRGEGAKPPPPGDSKAELLRYATSGDVTGDREEVVAYAAVTFESG